VVVDLLLGSADGLDLVRALKTSFPQVRTLVLSMYAESLYAERSLRAGARGYVAKLAPTETVIVAIRRVLAGDIYVSEAVATHLFSKLVGGDDAGRRNSARAGAAARNGSGPGDDLARLSDREFQVFGLIGKGLGPTDIAGQLGVSVKTIETYKDNLKKKLGLESGRDLLRKAVQYALEQEQISSPPSRPADPKS
jgi:DNA-binding NarL/FixJ family response regulator